MYVYCLSFRHLGRILTHLYIDMCVCMYMAHRVSFYFGVHQRGACWSILMHSVSSIAALSQHPFFHVDGFPECQCLPGEIRVPLKGWHLDSLHIETRGPRVFKSPKFVIQKFTIDEILSVLVFGCLISTWFS